LSETTITAPTSSEATPDHAARNRLVITLLLISTFVVILNETIMGVAIPQLMKDLRVTADAAQWLTAAFMLTMAVVIPITGFLLQRFHTRSVFIAAMTLFSAGTLFAALAPGFELLVVARVVQASGTAIMIPLLFTTVLTLVPEQSRGRVMGNISIVISVAPAIGPIISGLIINFLNWRWMYLFVLPFAVASLVIGAFRVHNVTEPTKTSIDVGSVIVSAFGFGGLVFGLSNVGTAGINAIQSWLPLVVGVVGITLFILRQLQLQKTDSALLDLRTFKARTFTFAVAMLGISMIALFGTFILLPIYTQNVLKLDPFTTGMLLLPGGLIMGLLAPPVGRLYDRIGPRLLVVTGSIIVSAAIWGMTLLTATSPFIWVLVAHVTLSIGLALVFTPLFSAGLGAVPPHLYSHGSAVVGTLQQLAGAAGVALFITVMSATVLRETGSTVATVAATAHGIHTAFIVGAIISLFAIPLAFMIRKPAPQEGGWGGGH
jgi:DHA2 family lincomycin resistance protein-like MFS transporter